MIPLLFDDMMFANTPLLFIDRHYATLYFIFVVDSAESELGILDLIQVFVETLDRCFENVCELDLIFHPDVVINILDEIIQGGLVLETQISAIVESVKAARQLEKTDSSSSLKSSFTDLVHAVRPKN